MNELLTIIFTIIGLILTAIGTVIAYFSYKKNKKSISQKINLKGRKNTIQYHSGSGDNVGGNKYDR